jgi:hypothetical protein
VNRRPIVFSCSAQTYVSAAHAGGLDVYGLDGASDPAVSRIHCPILAFFGTDEESCGTAPKLRSPSAADRVDLGAYSRLCPAPCGA